MHGIGGLTSIIQSGRISAYYLGECENYSMNRLLSIFYIMAICSCTHNSHDNNNAVSPKDFSGHYVSHIDFYTDGALTGTFDFEYDSANNRLVLLKNKDRNDGYVSDSEYHYLNSKGQITRVERSLGPGAVSDVIATYKYSDNSLLEEISTYSVYSKNISSRSNFSWSENMQLEYIKLDRNADGIIDNTIRYNRNEFEKVTTENKNEPDGIYEPGAVGAYSNGLLTSVEYGADVDGNKLTEAFMYDENHTLKERKIFFKRINGEVIRESSEVYEYKTTIVPIYDYFIAEYLEYF